MYGLINGRIIAKDKIIDQCAVIIENNKIANLCKQEELPKNIELIDVKGSYIAPGFIDLQINGCGGVLFNDDISLKTLQIMHETNLKGGCTAFIPTLITTKEDDIKKALAVAIKAYKEHPYNILGIHIEGPYISPIKKGIHNPKFITHLNQNAVNMLIDAVKDIPIILTLAPEENDKALIKKLIAQGIKVAIGHSNASYNEAAEVINLGAVTSTHLYNAMSGFQGREPGVIGAVFNHSALYAGIIVDGHHSNFASVAVAKKIKQEHLYIVTDAATPTGTNMKSFTFGGQEVFVKDGKLVNKDGNLGGSMINMIDSVKNMAEQVGTGLIEANRMASLYQTRLMGLTHVLGHVAKDYIANLAVFDTSFKMQYTIDNGKIHKIN